MNSVAKTALENLTTHLFVKSSKAITLYCVFNLTNKGVSAELK